MSAISTRVRPASAAAELPGFDQRVRNPVEERLVCDLRSRIRSGRLAPGTRLPPRRELQRLFKVSGVTVDRAVRRLIADGFVRARDRSGTFVAPTPPHLSRYGLVISQSFQSRFVQSLLSEGKRMEEQGPRQFPAYFQVRPGEASGDSARLLADLREERLAGLIFLSNPLYLDSLPCVSGFPDVPKVAIVGSTGNPAITAIHPDGEALTRLALDYFRKAGRRRLAAVTISQVDVAWADRLAELAAAHGIELRPAWALGLDVGAATWHRRAPALLFQGNGRFRPDALLVADDNLVEHVTLGLRDLGLRVPEDVEVVAHANFPLRPPAAVPVRWMGFEADRILQACTETLERQREGKAVPERIEVEPRFE
ncbi:MAG: transcriptional regulator PdhR [Lentisphaerae bacterium ADurb.BinA184]|nr:MAG: transcriptional regulator PdhR [Lentisphaerae bacterium ADurb.BinA184]